jgi:drug/metabolite transporter (DMT)-like permease
VHALALGLLLAAACIHVAWNLLLKGAAERDAVTFIAVLAGSVAFLPVVFLGAPLSGTAWGLAVASAAVETVYYLLLAHAYEHSDFSQAYPIARGTAPVLLAIWSALLLRELPSAAGAAGIALVVGGIVFIGLASSADPGATPRGGSTPPRATGPGSAANQGLFAALGVALCISIYSVIDGIAVRRTAPAPYTVAVLGLTALFLAPVALVRQGPRVLARAARGSWRRALAAGALMVIGYMLVLRAYVIERLAYAGAVREVSVVLAALIGWRRLGESFGPRRLFGAVAVFLGILTLALFG